MSYYIRFKDDRPSIRVSDERALAIADAKDAGKQVEIDGTFIDTAMISEIVDAKKAESRGAVNRPPSETRQPVTVKKQSPYGYDYEEVQRNADNSIAYEDAPPEPPIDTKAAKEKLTKLKAQILGRELESIYEVDGDAVGSFPKLRAFARSKGYNGASGPYHIGTWLTSRGHEVFEKVGDKRYQLGN